MRLAFGAVAGLLGLLAANTAQAQSLNVAFSNDANSSFTASTGDVFAFTGYSGSTTLVSGVSQTLTLAAVTENLGCCWNNTVYNNTVAEDITLNGVTDSTSQLWSVDDVEDPTTSVAESNTLVFAVDGGTVALTLDGTDGWGSIYASALYTAAAAAIPEPASLAMMAAGLATIGLMRRRARA